jgi:UDP-N-acetylglucosamine--N-acetylmuramyl-(pentapeptide) pyrophosphoryl-undecaprenol N-acetylglucosamine transferase
MTTVLIMAGGTGGHVFPALAVARVLRARDCEVVWLGTERGIEARVVPAADIRIEWVRVAGLRGKGIASWFLAPVKIARALGDSLKIIRRVRPDVVLGLGGFAAGPGGLAAWLLRRPLVIHEQNAVAGLTNRLLSRLATKVAEAFPGAFGESAGAVHVGNPVRAEIEAVSARRSAPHTPRHLLVFGGSQGAAVINRLLPEALATLPEDLRPRVLHQTGRGRQMEVASAYEKAGVAADVREFIDDMAAAYVWADLAVTRSGALTVAELASASLPAILIPFPAAVDDHQTANARALTQIGGALLLPESQLNAERLAQSLRALLTTPSEALTEMGARSHRAAQPRTADTLADLCLGVALRSAA